MVLTQATGPCYGGCLGRCGCAIPSCPPHRGGRCNSLRGELHLDVAEPADDSTGVGEAPVGSLMSRVLSTAKILDLQSPTPDPAFYRVFGKASYAPCRSLTTLYTRSRGLRCDALVNVGHGYSGSWLPATILMAAPYGIRVRYFTVPKKDSEHWPVLDLRSLPSGLTKPV